MTRQRTPSQDRTEYSQNTYYSHITRGDAYDPKQDPAPSQHTDYSDRTTNQSTNAARCSRTPSPNHTEYSAQDTDHCGTPHHEAPHCDNRDNSPGPGPQTETMAAEITQPSPAEDHTHEAPLSVSSGSSGTAMDIHSQLPTPPEAHDPPLESLPSGLDTSTNHDPMDLDNDPLQDSIQGVLQVAADAHQQPTWSLYRALNEADQRITSTGSNRDPGAYIQELRRDIYNAQQQSPEGVVVQGRETKTGAWTNLTRAPHAEEALDFIQESDAPPPEALEETAEALVLTLHSWTRGHTIVLHDKTGPPYARTGTCRLSIAATGEAHLEWKPEREDDEYTLVHATRHGHREEKEPTPEPAATPPSRPTPRHWTLYRGLAHARTLAEHSIRPYTEAAYVERMLQDWTKYETQVLEGHTGPPGATSRTTWDDIVPDGDIGALATTVRATFGDGSRPDHPFGDNRNPAITNAILAHHSWSIQQSIHLQTPHDDQREWHPIWPPALEFYLHEDAATEAHNITSLRPTMPQPIPKPHIPPSPTKPETPTRHEHRPPQQGHSPSAHEKAEPPNTTTTVQQLDKPLTLRHVPDN